MLVPQLPLLALKRAVQRLDVLVCPSCLTTSAIVCGEDQVRGWTFTPRYECVVPSASSLLDQLRWVVNDMLVARRWKLDPPVYKSASAELGGRSPGPYFEMILGYD